jgi:hypothetical protein
MLSFISRIEPKAIPRSILQMETEEETEHAIGTLCGYAFLVSRDDRKMFDMHRLVHMATRIWTEKHGLTKQVRTSLDPHTLATDEFRMRSLYLSMWRQFVGGY